MESYSTTTGFNTLLSYSYTFLFSPFVSLQEKTPRSGRSLVVLLPGPQIWTTGLHMVTAAAGGGRT